MGKVVKFVAAAVGVAVMVIPGVGTALGMGIFQATVGALGVSTAATLASGIIMTAMGAAVSMGSPTADLEPLDGPPGTFRGSRAILPRAFGAMLPIASRWHWNRWRVLRNQGDCMAPHVPSGRYILLDRKAEIRAGDLIVARTSSGTVSKRLADLSGGCLIVETTNPRQTYSIPLDKVKWAYRARAMGLSRWDALKAAMTITRDPEAHREKLASIIVRDDRRVV